MFNINMGGVTYADETYFRKRADFRMHVFEYVTEGCGDISVNGMRFVAKPNDVYYLPQGSCHEYQSRGGCRWVKIWFMCDGVLTNNLINAYGLSNFYLIHGNEKIRNYFEQILTFLRTRDQQLYADLPILFHKFIAALAANTNLEITSREASLAIRVKHYLNTILDSDFSLNRLCETFNTSKSQIIKSFNTEYKTSPYQYYLHAKINLAKNMLMQNSLTPVKEIAYMLKFSDEHYFSSLFKKKVGLTPNEYRKSF
jgi:AraC-like DNA-binding protein